MFNFTRIDATSVAEAESAMAGGKAAPLAGGTDLIPFMRGMFSPNPPEVLVNIKTIADLDYIKEEGGMLKIGALATLTAIAKSSAVMSNYTAIGEAAKAVGCPELRNMGTIGGNICQKPRCIYYRNERNAFPCLRKNSSGLCYAMLDHNKEHSIFGAVNGCVAICPSDLAPALVAMNATIVTNKRDVAAADFFAADGEPINVLASDELVTEIQVPTPASGVKSSYKKFAFRKSIDFPVVSCAAVIGGGSASIVLGGVYNMPRVATGAEESIAGASISESTAEAAGVAAQAGNATLPQNKYKVQLVKVMVKKAILACA